MKNDRNISRSGIIVAILLLAIGFASVTTILYINGTVNLAPDDENFINNVVFSEAKWDDTTALKSGASVSIVSDNGVNNKKISFTTHELKDINETATLSYKIKNDSQYIASIGPLSCTITDANLTDSVDATEYVSVIPTNSYSGSNLKLDSYTEATSYDSIVVKMIKSYAGDGSISVNVNCSLTATAE